MDFTLQPKPLQMKTSGKMRRRQRTSFHYTGRRPYSSSRPPPSEMNGISTYFPTFLILSSFLFGWLLGRHEGTRGIGVHFTLQSKEILQSLLDCILIYYGLAVRKECESSDGRSNNIAFCSTPQLLGKLMRERVALERRMQSKHGYGSYYHQFFNDLTTKSSPDIPALDEKKRVAIRSPLFLASPESTKKLSRRIIIKYLKAALREKSPTSQQQPRPTFTWITAGDSTAAAHGNLYSQSYTAILQDTVEDAFASFGIRFQAKNFGMGQYSSGPELGLCMNEVFGDDIDVLMWDFGSLQPDWEPTRRSVLWSNRAGLHPTRPILFSYDSFGERFLSLSEGDTGTILMDADVMQARRKQAPDSNVVLNLPDALSDYRCGPTLEGGFRCNDNFRNFVCYLDEELEENSKIADTTACRENKFRTKPDCLDARYQVSWHPGWKDHMLRGRLIGHFLINSLEEAMFELDQLRSQYGDDQKALLDHLESLEFREERAFRQKSPDTKIWDSDEAVFSKMGSEMVLRGESICHTALLPSRSRLEGITTETENGEFDTGVNQFLMTKDIDGSLQLAFDMNDRQHCDLLEVDHKDFFLVREQDGWVSTIVPNEKELEVYRRSTPVEGIIVLCLKICPLNKCPDAYMNINEIRKHAKLFMSVDGNPVTNVQKLDTCHILEGANGIRWGKKDQFQLSIRINDPGTLHVLKISSIIVF